MKIIKKILVFTMCFSLLSVGTMTDILAESIGAEVYEEKGQFSYEDFKLNNEEKPQHFTRSFTNENYDDVQYSPALLEEIERLERAGHTIEAIGYTKVYLKEEEANKEVLIPMTEKEVEEYKIEPNGIQTFATGTGMKSPGRNFTLYTVASFRGTDIYASSVGEYATYTFKPASETPQNGMYDYISISMPTQYTVTSPQVTRSNYGYYRADETNNAIAYGVKLKASPSTPGYTSTILSAVGKKNSNVNAKKIISGFTHNYSVPRLSLSLSASGTSFSVSPSSKTWTIYSSVVI